MRAARTRDQQTAYDALVDLAGRYKRGELIGPAGPTTVTFNYLLNLLVADYEAHNRASTEDMAARVDKHLRPWFGPMRVLELRKRDVQRFIASRLNGFEVTKHDGTVTVEKCEPATVNKLLAFLKHAMKLGKEEDPPLVLQIPEWFEAQPTDNSRAGVIDPDAYRVLRDELAPHARLAFVIGYHTGLRRGAILSLRWSWVDWRQMVIRIPASEDRETKRKPRIVPVYGDMRALMEMAYATRTTDYVVEFEGKRVNSIKTAWNAACRRAEITGTLFHDLRRTAATMLHEAGYELPTIMDLCGWKSEAMPKRYIQQSVRHVQNVGATMEQFIRDRHAAHDQRSSRGVKQ